MTAVEWFLLTIDIVAFAVMCVIMFSVHTEIANLDRRLDGLATDAQVQHLIAQGIAEQNRNRKRERRAKRARVMAIGTVHSDRDSLVGSKQNLEQYGQSDDTKGN